MKCIVLNFNKGNVLIFSINKKDNVEEILINKYNLSLNDIEFMIVEDLNLKILK